MAFIAFSVCFLLFGAANFAGVDGLYCYECSSLPHPRDCGKITECGSHEVCAVNRYITSDGLERYDSQCAADTSCSTRRSFSSIQHQVRTNHFPVCSKCCAGDYCNTELCDLKSSDSSLRCLSCPDVLNPSECREVAECLPNQICYTQEYNIGNEKRYRMGCTEKSSCATTQYLGPPILNPNLPLVGKRTSTTQSCEFCCDTPMCNMGICLNNTGAYALIRPPIYTTCADLNSDFCVYLALRDGSNVCTSLDVRDRLCPAFCKTCSPTGNVITQAPGVPQTTVTSTVATTQTVTTTQTASASVATTPLYGILQFGHYNQSQADCTSISAKRCHMLQCEIDICYDLEVNDLCSVYCHSNCRHDSCIDIPGLS